MVQFTPEYLVAVVGLAVGAAAGGSLTGLIRRSGDQSRIDIWDARVPAPLLLATAGAHLVLIPVVELQRQVMFGLYFVALLATVGLAIAGWRIWRLGAVLLPAGSILAYEFFAGKAHEADVIGLAVKLVELAAIAAALRPVFAARRRGNGQRQRAPSG